MVAISQPFGLKNDLVKVSNMPGTAKKHPKN